MRLDTLPPTMILYILLLTSPTKASVHVDFSAYPAAAQSCLTQAVENSGCSSANTVSKMNDCLCSNTRDFVLDSARCLASMGSSAVLMNTVYDNMQQSCSETKSPLSVSEADWLAEGKKKDETVTSTITTTRGTMVMTFSTTIIPDPTSAAYTTSTARAYSIDEENDKDSDEDDNLSLSAKIGVISSTIAGFMTLASIACMIIFYTKRKKDKQLLAEARAEAARAQEGRDKDQDRGLLSPGAATPGLPPSPGRPTGGVGAAGYDGQVFGASVVPPTPTYPGPGLGPAEAQPWRGGIGGHGGNGMAASPSELTGDSVVFQLYDGHPQQQQNSSSLAWPSPLTLVTSRGLCQGPSRATTLLSESSWAPSPASAFPSSNALGTYNNNPNNAARSGADSTISSPTARQGADTTIITTTSRSSWAHNRPYQEEPYELPGVGVNARSPSPVEADSKPILMTLPPDDTTSTSNSRRISTLPEYSAGGWIDPNTDKPPL
jgi:hypothetical protein